MQIKISSKRSRLLISFLLVMTLTLSSMVSFAEFMNTDYFNQKALEGKISVDVLDKFSSGEEKVEVLVKLKDQGNVESLSSTKTMELSSLSLNNKQIRLAVRENVIESLEQNALRTQKKLINYIERELKLGNIEEYESYYIVNMVYVKGNKNVINKIALMNEVEMVYFNEIIKLNDYTVSNEGSIQVIEDINSLEEINSPAGTINQISGREDATISAVSPSDIEWNIKQVNADKVWNTYGIDGTGVVIGMIDSGVTWNHPALKNKYRGYNASTGTVNHSASWFDAYAGKTTPYDEPSSPHGTHVMGTILGQEASGKNAIGVAPGAKFIVAKGLGPNGGTSSDLISAAQWMLKPGGSAANAPSIICNSWGGGTGINNWYREVVKSWRAAGILPVFAAGNQTPGEPAPWPGSISLPSSYPESFAVGATDLYNRRGSFSKLGPSPYNSNLPKPDISAPGVNIRSSVINGYEGGWDGTSMACPNISGVAALILQANPNLTVVELENVIKNTATPLKDSTYTTSPNMGFGYGLVNALKAVESVKGTTPTPTTGTVTGRITDDGSGIGISGAKVTIDGSSVTTTTNSSGYYTLYNVPSGTQTMRIAAAGYKEISGSINVIANQSVTINGTMVKDAVTPPVTTGTVTGRITDDSTGYGISGAKVTIDSVTTTTNSSGYYTLYNVPSGTQTIRTTATGYKEISGSITVTANKTVTINGTMVKDAVTPPVTTGTVTGRITDYSTGYGISGAKVTIDGVTTTTNSIGYYTLYNVPSGTQTIRVTATGYNAISGLINVSTNRTVTINGNMVKMSGYKGYSNGEIIEVENDKSIIVPVIRPIIEPIIELPIITNPTESM